MLHNRLAGLSPRENDRVLAEIWQAFAGTEAYQLLVSAINEINAEAKGALLDPRTEPHARSHAAGQCMALERILATIKAGITFDPALAEYDVPEDEEIIPDEQQLV